MMTKILRLIETLALALFFGFLPVLLCVAAAGFVNVIFLEEKGIAYWALGGLVVGLIIDCLFVKSWITKAYQMNNKIFVAIYLFYSVVALGMCMGVPILNFALGIAAGIYIARRMHFVEADEEKRKLAFKRTSTFCAWAMVMVCCLITFWGAIGGMIGSRFEAPFLSFTFTAPVYFAIAFVSGAFLVLLQYWLTRITAKVAYKLHTRKAGSRIAVAVIALVAIVSLIGLGWHALDVYRTHRKQAAQQATGDERRETSDERLNSLDGNLSFRYSMP